MNGGKGQNRRAAPAPGVAEVRLPYSPGLDGLRALAVIAVLLYHADLPWIPGGFLGVEVFFVISGYLITALLLAEWQKRGTIDLKNFWLRRARRLLPALYVLVVVCLAYAVVFLPGEVAGLRGDAVAAFGYVTNWYLIFGHESYFEAVGRPSLLKHLWSLAVEEQFYLLWPPILALGLGVAATRLRYRRVLFLALGGAVASAVAMALLYQPGADPSRVYYGTDTRATGLLIGATLAFLWVPQPSTDTGTLRRNPAYSRFRRRWKWAVPALLDIVGIGALGALIWFSLHLGEFQPLLYRGGLVAVGFATAALIAVIAYPRARTGSRLLAWRPLRWVGERSYGIYLWHWPVFMVTRPDLDVPFGGWPLLCLRLGATVVLADLSYRYVETPIRRGALGRAWKRLRESHGSRQRRLGLRWAAALVPAMALCAALGMAAVRAEPPEKPSYLSTKRVHIEAADRKAIPGTKTQGKASTTRHAVGRNARWAAGPPAGKRGWDARAGWRKDRTERGSAASPAGQVTAIGDSVMLGAVDALQKDIPKLTTIDARGSRQIPEATRVLRQLRADGELGKVVIVHIGDNGGVTDEQFDQMMKVLSNAKQVLVVNTTVPDGYRWAPNNEVLADGVARHQDKAVLVDWHAESAGHPEYFWDGLHLTPKGARAYAGLIAAAYRAH